MSDEIAKGKKVKVEYTGKLENGEVFDTSKGRAPLEFFFGEGKMIAGFEENIEGMKAGEKKTFTIPPEKAYGNPDPVKVIKVGRKELADKGIALPKIGLMLSAGGMLGKIVEVTDSEVKIDFNHPLAGKALTFEVEIVSVE